MSRCFRAGQLWGMVSFLLGGLPVYPSMAEDPVDVELVLAVDVSLSMSPDELEIQRKGYTAALTDPQAIAAGAYGKIAVAYFEWAGSSTQRLIVPWIIIASADDAERVAPAFVTKKRKSRAQRPGFSIEWL